MRPPDLIPSANCQAEAKQSQQQNRSIDHASLHTSSNSAQFHGQLATTLPTLSESPESQNSMFKNIHCCSHGPLPPSFDELDHERSYLLDCLQHENLKATQLLRRITPLEEDLINDNLPSNGNRSITKRKMRNQIGWFKSRLEETARQERAILAKLGRLTFQIQETVRSTQVEEEYREFETLRRSGLLDYHQNLAPMQRVQQNLAPYYPATQYAPKHVPTSVPEWQQRHGDYGWQRSTHEVPSGDPHSEEVPPSETPKNESLDISTSKNRKPSNYFRRTVSTGDADLDSSFSKHEHTCRPVLKRLSLPTIPGLSQIWSLTREERETAKGEHQGPKNGGSDS